LPRLAYADNETISTLKSQNQSVAIAADRFVFFERFSAAERTLGVLNFDAQMDGTNSENDLKGTFWEDFTLATPAECSAWVPGLDYNVSRPYFRKRSILGTG